MEDQTLRNLVQAHEGDLDALNELLACYEAWGGKPTGDADCARFLGAVPEPVA